MYPPVREAGATAFLTISRAFRSARRRDPLTDTYRSSRLPLIHESKCGSVSNRENSIAEVFVVVYPKDCVYLLLIE
jgi:hypothetical protein